MRNLFWEKLGYLEFEMPFEEDGERLWQPDLRFSFLPIVFQYHLSHDATLSPLKAKLSTFCDEFKKYKRVVLRLNDIALKGEKLPSGNFEWYATQDLEGLFETQNSAFDLYLDYSNLTLEKDFVANLALLINSHLAGQ